MRPAAAAAAVAAAAAAVAWEAAAGMGVLLCVRLQRELQ